MAEKRAVWEEAVRGVIPMMKEGPAIPTATFRFPIAQCRAEAITEAAPAVVGRLLAARDDGEVGGAGGLGALGFQFLTADAAHAWVHAYYNAFTKRQEKLADYVTNPNIALVSFFMCAKTDEEARERADGITFFQFALRFYGRLADRQRPQPGTVNMWDEYEKWKKANPEAQAARCAAA